MEYAVIDNNIVTNIFNITDENQLPICETLIKIPEDLMIKVGDFYFNGNFKTNYNGNEELEILKKFIADLMKNQKELSQRVYQLEKNIL